MNIEIIEVTLVVVVTEAKFSTKASRRRQQLTHAPALVAGMRSKRPSRRNLRSRKQRTGLHGMPTSAMLLLRQYIKNLQKIGSVSRKRCSFVEEHKRFHWKLWGHGGES
jgi:hypothetical protein